jgi:hypothetical protein
MTPPGEGFAAVNEELKREAVHAIIQEDVERLRELLVAGLPANSRDEHSGQTLLHTAAKYDVTGPAELLLAHGAAIDARENLDGFTPLHTTGITGATGVAELLMTHGADLRARSNPGSTPPQVAAINGHAELLDRMLTRVRIEDVDAADSESDRLPMLHCAAHGGHLRAVQVLLAHGAAVDEQDFQGCTALDRARAKGHSEIVALLTEHTRRTRARTNDPKCFIATAACGKPGAYEVNVFRSFRDSCLRVRACGRACTRAYERFSPPAARWIEHRPLARHFTRVCLLRPLARLVTWVAGRRTKGGTSDGKMQHM